MRTFQIQNQIQSLPRGSSSSARSVSGSSGDMSPLSTAGFITLTALLILSVPVCTGAPVELHQATTDQRQLLSQASDVLGELCVLMLVQKSKELKVRESSKRAELQGPGGIQSRGHFLYRPRNGRRSLEYE
ncbi:neuromedin-U [Xyrichtys novacula]|uniref:Neuromedin-U n=1 Tax=Xyrichtys novacula TaxID=13765 RepID=A0AAV1FH57_XYRNO|nr:neuromedin-U [Xyrichtys novacula]